MKAKSQAVLSLGILVNNFVIIIDSVLRDIPGEAVNPFEEKAKFIHQMVLQSPRGRIVQRV